MGGEYQARQPDPLKALAAEIKQIKADNAALRRALTGVGLQVDPDTNDLVVTPGRGIGIRGGAITIYDDDGNPVALLGNFSDGSTGVKFVRPDGSPAFLSWNDAGGFTALFDRGGNYILTDDVTAAQGLARPYIPIGTFTDNTAPTSTTTSSTFTTLQSLVGYKQHPKLYVQVLVQAVSAGQVRVVDQDNNQVGATQTFSAGAFQYVQFSGSLLGAHMQAVSLNLQARITSGTSPIGVRGVNAIGVESAGF